MKKHLKYVFSSLSVGLTLISMNSGFYFYLKLLDLTTAILAILVFEVLRLSTLYALVVWTVKKKLLAAPLYFLVASICAFAATSSFHATIIERHNIESSSYRSEVEKRVNLMKKTYAGKFADEVASVDKEIDRAQIKIAARSWSTYWPKRVEQLSQKRQQLLSERDTVLSSVPQQNAERWLSHHAAILDITLKPLAVTKGGSSAISLAIQELWDVSELAVKKIVAVIITVVIEIGILFLAIFAGFYSKSKTTEADFPRELEGGNNNGLVKQLGANFDEPTIKKFAEKARPFYARNNRLPSARDLSKNLRPIRTMIARKNLNKEEIEELLRCL